MTKTLAAILIPVAVVLFSNTPAAGNPRDIWVGVLGFREPFGSFGPGGREGIDLSIVLKPVAALVGGKWWFESDQNDQWLPPGTVLPSSWQAHVFDRRRVALRTSGPLEPRGDHPYASELVVKTDLPPPRAQGGDSDGAAQGIAIAGDVRVQLFVDLAVWRHAELLRFFTARMLATERAEIQRKAEGARGIAGAFPNDADVKQMMTVLASTPFKTNVARTATQRGEPVYVIEGSKILNTRDITAVMYTGAAARRDRGGALHLVGAWSYLDANEWAFESRPLVVLERNGESCWLVAHATEGGYDYTLNRPGQIGLEGFAFPFNCDIK